MERLFRRLAGADVGHNRAMLDLQCGMNVGDEAPVLFFRLAERKAERQLRKGHGLNKIAKALGIGVGTVVRIKAEMPPETQASECPPKARGRSCAPFIHRGRPTSSFKRG